MLAELFFGKRIEGFSRWKEKQEKRLNKARKRMSPPDKIEKDVYDRVEIGANTRKKEKEMIVLRDIQEYYTSILLSTATKPDNSQTAMGRSPKS